MPTVAVAFDIDHTLAIDNKLERVAFLHLLDRVIEAGGAPLGALAEEANNIDALLAYQRGGGCTIEEAVERFVTERGAVASQDYIDGFKRMALAMAETFVVPDPDAKRTIDALADSGIVLGVLSNGWSPLQNAKARRAGFTGTVLASADLGVQKPDRRAFAALSKQLDVAPENSFFVGDDPRADIAGSLAAGFRAVWLDNEGKTYPPDLPAPTHTIRSLRELPAIVGAVALR